MKFTVKTFIQVLFGPHKDFLVLRDETMKAEPHIKWDGTALYIFHPTEWPLKDGAYFDCLSLDKKDKTFYLTVSAENYWYLSFQFESGKTLIKNKIYKVSDYY